MALINKDFIVKNGLQIESTATSTSPASGSLIVAGGAGIAKDLWLDGAFIRSGNLVTGGDFSQGAGISSRSASYVDNTTTGTLNFSIVNYLGTATVDTTNTGVIYNNAVGLYIDGAPSTVSNKVSIINSWGIYLRQGNTFLGGTAVNTSGTNNNALQVDGGISAKGLHITGGGRLEGMFYIDGSEIVTRANQNTGTFSFSELVLITTSTDSVSTTTGALQITRGGIGVVGNIYVGGRIVGVTTGTFLSTQNATSTSSGALTVSGGLGVGQDLYARNGIFVSGNASTSSVSGNSLQVTNSGGLGISGTALIQGQTWITNTSAGALNVIGGAGVGGTLTANLLHVINTATLSGKVIISDQSSSTSTTQANALYVAGGIGIEKDLVVAGNAVLLGDLSILGIGTQVLINSTQTYIIDPVIDIGTAPNNGILQTLDVFDKGIMLHYNDGSGPSTDNHAFMGYEHTQGRFIFKKNIYPGGIETFPVTDLKNTGTYATVDAGTLYLLDNTTSTDVSTGALVVTGGVGIGGGVWIAGDETITSNNYSLTSISGNALQVINGGIGARYIYVDTAGYINNAEIITTSTLAANLGGDYTNIFSFKNPTQSISTDTGALIVAGGVGIGGNLNIGGNFVTSSTVYVWSVATATNNASGAVIIAGGLGVGDSVYASALYDQGNRVITRVTGIAGTGLSGGGVITGTTGTIAFTNTGVLSLTASTGVDISTSTGNITVTNTGVITLTAGTDTAVSASAGSVTIWNTSTLQSITDRGASTTNAINILNADPTTSTTSGALQVSGGVGIGTDLFVGGNVRGSSIQVSNNLISSPTPLTAIATTETQILDAFVSDVFKTVKYLVQIIDTTSTVKFHVVEILLTYDGSGTVDGTYISQYGMVTNLGELGDFTAQWTAGMVTLEFTPNYVPTSMSLQAIRLAITA